MKSDHRFAVELYDEGGASLGQAPMEVDWEPAEESARFHAVRDGVLDPAERHPSLTLSPLWHHQLGEPYTTGFRIAVTAGDRAESGSDFASRYFRNYAQAAATGLVEAGRLKQGDRYHYVVAAFPVAPAPDRVADPAFRVRDVSPPLPLTASPIAPALAASLPHGEVAATALPVFVPDTVLAEAGELARTAHDRETGGVLVGYLRQDPEAGQIFVVVTAQLPATLAHGEATRLQFTPETWSQINGVLALRRRGEIMVGWWHSHPVLSWECKNCPVEKRRVCPVASDFFSAQDRALHRAVFPRAYTVALVINQLAEEEQTFSLFGWHQGLLETRGFYVLNGLPSQPAPGVPG